MNRSSIDTIPSQFIARNLSTSIQLFEKQDNQKEASESNKNPPEKSSSNDSKESGSSHQNSNNDDKKKKNQKTVDDKDRENSTNKAIAYLTKAILWICLIYSISFTIIVVTSILNGGGAGSGGNGKKGDSENFTVSWKEFVQYMLASGEVKEVIIRPQYEYVRIILHDGAIINGRRPRFSSYMLTVPNTERFEQRLREVERSMGIAEGIVT